MPLLIHETACMDDTKTETYIDMDMALAPRCASTHAKAGIVGLQLLVHEGPWVVSTQRATTVCICEWMDLAN